MITSPASEIWGTGRARLARLNAPFGVRVADVRVAQARRDCVPRRPRGGDLQQIQHRRAAGSRSDIEPVVHPQLRKPPRASAGGSRRPAEADRAWAFTPPPDGSFSG